MPQPTPSATQFSDTLRRFPKVFFAFAISLALAGIGYAVTVYKEKKNLPVLQLGGICRILHYRFHADGVFPLKIKPALAQNPEFKPIDDDNFERDNYVFRFHRIRGNQAVIWATPKGELRNQGYTYLLVFTPDTVIVWRGPVQTPSESTRISEVPVPEYPFLSRLGMGEIARSPLNSASTY
jgi:hypothetical protein